jgi:methyl-accepting chemotaxis protein
MKLSDRIALLKAGYTKDEISELVREDQEKAEQIEEAAEPAAEAPAEYMEVIRTLADEVKSLKDAVHASNIEAAEVKAAPSKTAVDILKEIYERPPKDNKEN